MSAPLMRLPTTARRERKRVSKACNSCRLKKAKCDGTLPCGRCREDDRPCSFSSLVKPRKKERPKGYTELLEQEYVRIVAGLRESYRRLREAGAWSSPQLPHRNGYVAVHDLLEALGINDKSGQENEQETGKPVPCPLCQARPSVEEGEDESSTDMTSEDLDLADLSSEQTGMNESEIDDLIASTLEETDIAAASIWGEQFQNLIEGFEDQELSMPDSQRIDQIATSWLDLAPDYMLSSWTPGCSTLRLVQDAMISQEEGVQRSS